MASTLPLPFITSLLAIVFFSPLPAHSFLLSSRPTHSQRKLRLPSASLRQRPLSASVMSGGASQASDEWALIFDCDGVIIESEGLHRDAYNAMFREFAIPYEWTPEYYDVLQNMIGGGIPKMRHYFTENGWPSSTLGPPPADTDGREGMLKTLQDRKTIIYKSFISEGTAQPRPGVLRVMEEAMRTPGTKLAICSASTKSSCLFVLENLLGKDLLSRFDLILAGDDVTHRKPHPEIYHAASERLAIPPSRCLVIEDSLIGLQAALQADMKCVITHTHSTGDQVFDGAEGVYADMSLVTAADLRGMVLERAVKPAVQSAW
mmetsp:Transcript_22652/g.55892  ORF Transcript_22652/g.55892 Transcript_22652/m.55892 type:complete len:319 (+) Transcript_22652:221-1177(+)